MQASIPLILLDLSTWWLDLSTLQQVYWGIALVGTLFFIFILISTFAGADGDFDTDPDMDVEMDGGGGIQFFTLKNLVGFFTIFGWSGLACIEFQLSFPFTIVISVVCGLIMMGLMAWLFYFMSQMVQSGTLSLSNAVNGYGEVYLTVPGKRGGLGKIQIKVQGALRELDAMTDDLDDIGRGAVVKVREVINDQILLVSKQ